MKTFLTALLILIAFNVMAQTPALQKLWVGDNKLYVRADTGNIISFQSLVAHVVDLKERGKFTVINNDMAGRYRLINDTLRISDWYFPLTPTTDFLIDTSAKNKLVLTPVNLQASGDMENLTGKKQNKYVFNEVHQIATDSIRFEKIIYKIQGGYPSVQTTVYELNRNGKLRMFKEKRQYRVAVPGIDKLTESELASEPGATDEYLIANVPKALVKQLTDILKISEIDKLPEAGHQNIDVTNQTIEVYYNHKVKYMIAGWMPFVAEALANYLRTLPQKVTLTSSAEKFEIKLYNKPKGRFLN